MQELIQKINQLLNKPVLTPGEPEGALKAKMAAHINDLILHDFPSLVQLLYRIDIDESALRQLLQQNREADAGLLIAEMIIQREKQKAASRRLFKQNKTDENEEKF
ncbi:MAG: hypothetical protein N2747_09130 [Chitinophagaceae bacterium]|nr:hypothetical protein [Chitinophagaceae bacterium]